MRPTSKRADLKRYARRAQQYPHCGCQPAFNLEPREQIRPMQQAPFGTINGGKAVKL